MAKPPKHRRDRLAALTCYIPAYSDPTAPVGEWFQPEAEPGTISAASFMLHASAERFVADCYAHGWVLGGFDWAAWAQTARAQALRDDPAVLASATAHELAQLLTVVIRQSRFVEGALAGAFEGGLILGILKRAEQLSGEGGPTH